MPLLYYLRSLHNRVAPGIAVLCAGVLFPSVGVTQAFQCDTSTGSHGHLLSSQTLMNADPNGFGWDLGTVPENISKGACGSEEPFYFSVGAHDGNYRVRLVLGGNEASVVTIRGESRRLYVKELSIPAGGSASVAFNVHIRTANIFGNAQDLRVKLKPREMGALDWDSKLTLEFNGQHPSVRVISIEPLNDVHTVYLAGDSTVVDQEKEPWAAWGQMLPAFFGPRVSIANEAESGETIKSFVGELRLAKIMSTIKAGDFLLIQFAHNDQKPGSGFVPAATEYKDLLRRYIVEARLHHATPILVTSMNRRVFDTNGKIVPTLGDYPQAVREVATAEKVDFVDLNSVSKTLFEALGEQGTLRAFVHYPANTFPDQPEALKDNTHFNSYGAYELANAVVQSIRDQKLLLSKYLLPGAKRFDPAHPDSPNDWTLPRSPSVSVTTPYGR